MADKSFPAEEIFPSLTPEQVARIAHVATERKFQRNEAIWEQGDCNRPLYVVLEGEMEITSGTGNVVTIHTSGEFSGDVDLLSDRPVVVGAHARTPLRVLELSQEKLRDFVQTDAELSEIFLRAFLMRRTALMAQGQGSVVLIGSQHSAGTLTLREFLTRNGQPYAYLDVDRERDIQGVLDDFALKVEEVPVVICRGTRVLKKPTIEELGECLGLNRIDTEAIHDVVIVGAGPGGLAAAVYATSEGLGTLVLEANAPGGQAASSSRIENYLGFPTGISGQDLASRAFVQAEKFGAEFAVARSAVRLGCERRPFRLELADGTKALARTVIIATGVRYRKPELPGLGRFEGVGIYYAATQMEANFCKGEDVIVVGGGNSAGQAAVYLSTQSRKVHVLVRAKGLAESMSRYLIRRIEETANIELHPLTQIEALEGGDKLERVTWRDASTGETKTQDIGNVFLMTGAEPNTAWLGKCVALDSRGFVKTGQDLSAADISGAKFPSGRAPYFFETSVPGVFAVGDVRASSVKRVAAAVGEGSVCVQLVHRVLAE